MKANITIWGDSYDVWQMVDGSFLNKNWFKKDSWSDIIHNYVKWNEKLILEVFEKNIFKITWIDDYFPPVKKTNW